MATQIPSIQWQRTQKQENWAIHIHIKEFAKAMAEAQLKSSPCMVYMHQKSFAACIWLAFSATAFCIIGILYVDDMDLFIFAEYATESAEQVAGRMQNMMTHWQGCLQVTGGDVNLDKCNWMPIGFYWDENAQWYYWTHVTSSVLIPDGNGVMQVLEKLSPSQATMVVGVVQAADGSKYGQAGQGPQGYCQ
jgi:hypothetical protein